MLTGVITSTTAVSMLSVTILLVLTTILVRKDILETDKLARNLVISVALVDWKRLKEVSRSKVVTSRNLLW